MSRLLSASVVVAATVVVSPAMASKDELLLNPIEHHFLLPPPESAIGPADLGRGLTRELRPIDPVEGALGPAFPNKTREIPTNKCRFQFLRIVDSFSLSLNANYLIASANGGTAEERRHMIYRAYCTSKVVKLEFEAGAKPEGAAVVTPVAIHYGWSLDVAISGSKEDLHAGVAAKLASLGGELSTQKKTYRLESNQVTRGLEPRKESSIHLVTSADDILTHYEQANDPAPILVEYMLTKPVTAKAIDWKQESETPGDGEYLLKILKLEISQTKIVRGRSRKWDGFGGGGPDVRVRVNVPRNGSMTLGGQRLCKNSFQCSIEVPVLISGTTPIEIVVAEQDLSADDPVGVVKIADLKGLGKPGEIVSVPAASPQIVKLLVQLEKQ